jgi:hypothetical protein
LGFFCPDWDFLWGFLSVSMRMPWEYLYIYHSHCCDVSSALLSCHIALCV